MAKNKALAKAAEGSVAAPSMSKEHEEREKHYETNRHLDTISEAMDIMDDPVKLERVKKMVGRKHKAVKSISDLRRIRNEKAMDDKDES